MRILDKQQVYYEPISCQVIQQENHDAVEVEEENTEQKSQDNNGVIENQNEDIVQTTGIFLSCFLLSYSTDIKQENNDTVQIEEENTEQKSQDENGVLENQNEDIVQTTGIIFDPILPSYSIRKHKCSTNRRRKY